MTLRDDTRGAVYVEFLIAFIPVLTFFLCVLQLAMLYTAKLYVDHAAVVAARSAAVVFGDDPKDFGNTPINQLSERRRDAVRRAALLALAPLVLDGTVLSLNIVYPNPAQSGGADALTDRSIRPMQDASVTMVRVRVEAMARCKIAIANKIACSPLLALRDGARTFGLAGGGAMTLLRSESVYPYQGASYAYERP